MVNVRELSDDLPAGFRNRKVLEMAVGRWRFGRSQMEPWIRLAKEAFDFYDNDPWSDEDLAKFHAENRRVLRLNVIRNKVDSLVGLERQSRTDIRAFPVETGDETQASLLTRYIKDVNSRRRGDYIQSEQFKQGVIGGRGWRFIGGDKDTIADIKLIDDPSDIILDPSSRDFNMADADWLIRERWLTFRQIRENWPERSRELELMGSIFGFEHDGSPGGLHELAIGDGIVDDFANAMMQDDVPDPRLIDREQGRAKVLQMWHRRSRTTWRIRAAETDETLLVTTDQPTPGQVRDIREALRLRAASSLASSNRLAGLGLLPPAEPESLPLPEVKIEREKTREMWLTEIAMGVVLQHGQGPYEDEDFPFIPFYALVTKGVNRYSTRGMVFDMIDAQKLKNIHRMQMLDNTNRSTHSGWLIEKGSIEDTRKLSRFGSMPGVVIQYTRTQNPPQRLDPMPLPEAYLQLERMAELDLETVSGISRDLLGLPSDAESGVQSQIRIRQSQVSLAQAFDNNRQSNIRHGILLINRLKQFGTEEGLRRLIGSTDWPTYQDAARTFLARNEQEDDYEIDIRVDEIPFTPSYRINILNQLINLAKTGVPFPPEAFMVLADLPPEVKQGILGFVAEERSRRAQEAAAQPGAGGQPGQPGQPGQQAQPSSLPGGGAGGGPAGAAPAPAASPLAQLLGQAAG